jgi:hypothetical protein
MVFMNTKDVAGRIQALIDELKEIKEILELEEIQMPPEALERMQRNECLVCKKSLAGANKVVRGCHNACFQRVRRKYSEQQAVMLGLLALPEKGGRQPSADPVFESITAADPTLQELRGAAASGAAAKKAKSKNTKRG